MTGANGRSTLPGRVPGRLYDEHGGEVFVRAEAFEALPYERRPRIYDHTGARVVSLGEPVFADDVQEVDSGDEGGTDFPVMSVFLGIIRMIFRIVALLARLV